MDRAVSTVQPTEDLRNAHCPFLSLPGELRNRIYDYCVEAGPIALPPAIHQWAPSFPEFGSLRHTSRVLHAEFSPLYLRRTIISIHHSDVERYISAVYGRQQALANECSFARGLGPNTHGHIRISVRQCDVLDLTPFAGLLARAPNLHFEFACKAANYAALRNITDLLASIAKASNSVDFEAVVDRILFRCSFRSQIVVKLHRNVRLCDLFTEQNRSPREWIVQQGLPELGHLEIVMESSKGVLRDPPSYPGWSEPFPNSRIKLYRGPTRFVAVNKLELRLLELRVRDKA